MATQTHDQLLSTIEEALKACGYTGDLTGGGSRTLTPLTGENLFAIPASTKEHVTGMFPSTDLAFKSWREVPAPRRGNVIKRWGELLTEHKRDLGILVQVEAGKSMSEAEGEVQEMIDICDFALGQSRMLYGKTMPSERPGHRLMET